MSSYISTKLQLLDPEQGERLGGAGWGGGREPRSGSFFLVSLFSKCLFSFFSPPIRESYHNTRPFVVFLFPYGVRRMCRPIRGPNNRTRQNNVSHKKKVLASAKHTPFASPRSANIWKANMWIMGQKQVKFHLREMLFCPLQINHIRSTPYEKKETTKTHCMERVDMVVAVKGQKESKKFKNQNEKPTREL